jgi:hypothetical protein
VEVLLADQIMKLMADLVLASLQVGRVVSASESVIALGLRNERHNKHHETYL